MSAPRALWRILGPLTTAGALLVSGARAQLSVAADVQSAGAYVWRGITRSQVGVLQPALAITLPGPCSESGLLCFVPSGGVWMNWQVARAGADETSDLAPAKRGISEVNWWLEGAARSEVLELAAGFVRYLYPATDAAALRTRADDTSELYARLRWPRSPWWLKPSIGAWLDVGHGGSAYVEATAIGGLDLFPMLLETNLDLGATVGLGLGRPRHGLTHVELSLGPSARLGALRLALDLHPQWNIDRAAQVAARIGVTRPFSFWVAFSAGYTWGS